jgi:predicted regulator of Ras-like GTPase activity (Roadblock/LC7/MglB family)/TusA-related sulfurtransferase
MNGDQSVNKVVACGEMNVTVCTEQTKKVLDELKSGETLKVFTMHPDIRSELESLLKDNEGKLLEELKGDGIFTYILMKGPQPDESEAAKLFLSDIIEKLQFSSGLDIAVIDMEGNVKASKLKYSKTHEIGKMIVEALEKTGRISEVFATGRIEEYVVHGNNGYTLVKVDDPHIVVISGLKENQLGLAMQKMRQIKKN